MRDTKRILAAACFGVVGFVGVSSGQVVINEVVYDDGSTDDREYVELFNAGVAPVLIGGWTVGGQDEVGANPVTTITTGTMLAAGAYYVIGQTGVSPNQIVASIYENDSETIELRNAGVLVDALLYEANKGPGDGVNPPGTRTDGHGVLPALVSSNVGPGVWGNNQSTDLAGTPLRSSGGLGRFVDGRDTDNNGRDFGFRPNTPGATNNPTNITSYTTPDPTGSTVGATVPGFGFAFVAPRYINPTVADTNNPNVIADSPTTPSRAIVAWDPSGGGNGVTSVQTYNTTDASFSILAYLDTSTIPLNSNTSAVTFRGSEITVYGIGSTEALSNLTNLTGATGVTGIGANGTTGLAWVYERAGETTLGGGDKSVLLHLVDANDGGDSVVTGGMDWTILETVNLGSLASGWFELGIDIDLLGNVVAKFNGNTYLETTSVALNGAAFNVAYRENLQIGADGTPDAIMRPATFTLVPEPTSLALVGLTGFGLMSRRRRS